MGGTIGTHFAAQTDRVKRASIAGTYFELNLSQGHWHDDNVEIARIAKATREGTLDALNLDEGRRRFAESMDLDRIWARRYAMESWPAVQPVDLRCPILIYSGTNDGQIVEMLRQQRAVIEEAGQTLHIFEGFDHLQLVSERAVIMPIIQSFLQG